MSNKQCDSLLNVEVLSPLLQHYLVYKLSCDFRKPLIQSPAPGKDQFYNLKYSPKKLLFNLFFAKKFVLETLLLL